MSSFAEIAPYLKDSLVLGGFALFLFFGALRFIVRRLPVVSRRIAGVAVLRPRPTASSSRSSCSVSDCGSRRLVRMRPARQPSNVRRARIRRLRAPSGRSRVATRDLRASQEQIKALAGGQTAQAKAIFRRISEEQAPSIQEALAAYHRATELDPENTEGWNPLGNLYRRAGQLDNAIAACRGVIELARTRGDRTAEATGIGNFGIVYRIRGDLHEAEEMFKVSLAINEALGRQEGMAGAYGTLGIIHKIRGDLAQARTAWEKSLSLFRAMGSPESDRMQQSLDSLDQAAE